jgi:dTDP-4-dehydrorhamnose reductase
MISLGEQGKAIRVVNDQVGCPTFTGDLAKWTLDLIPTDASGIYHAVNSGRCSWYELAKTIFLLKKMNVNIEPVSTGAFPSVAKRPAFSILNNTRLCRSLNYDIRKWPEALSEYLASSTL